MQTSEDASRAWRAILRPSGRQPPAGAQPPPKTLTSWPGRRPGWPCCGRLRRSAARCWGRVEEPRRRRDQRAQVLAGKAEAAGQLDGRVEGRLGDADLGRQRGTAAAPAARGSPAASARRRPEAGLGHPEGLGAAVAQALQGRGLVGQGTPLPVGGGDVGRQRDAGGGVDVECSYEPLPVTLLTASRRLMPAKTRAFIDHLFETKPDWARALALARQ